MDQTTITLQDLSTIVSIIDVCSERGAFKGNELMVVGQIREKVSAFVKQNEKAAEATTETVAADETESAE